MTDARPDTQKTSGGAGVIFELTTRFTHVGNAINELKKAPFLSAILTTIVFIFGFLAQQIASYFYDAYKPDVLKSEAEHLSETLLEKSVVIETRVEEIVSLMAEIQSGSVEDPRVLQEKMNELLASINGIQPDLSEVARMRSDLFLVSSRQKSRDIEVAGMSPNTDVTLKMNDGATICRMRYSFAVSPNGSSTTIRPWVGLTSPTGESSRSTLETGRSLTLSDDLGTVVVSYVRHEVIDGEAYYGFNFTCPS